MKDLNRLFYPRTIAVVGASDKMFKWGSYIFTNLVAAGFKGEVYPVTVTKDEIYGRKAYKSLMDIPGEVDLVFNTTPAKQAMEVLRACVAKGVKNVIMITSGFSETGAEEGARGRDGRVCSRERDQHGGPNTMGIVNTAASLFATGSLVKPLRGGISIVAQSGNVGNQVMESAEQQDIEHDIAAVQVTMSFANAAALAASGHVRTAGREQSPHVGLQVLQQGRFVFVRDRARDFIKVIERHAMHGGGHAIRRALVHTRRGRVHLRETHPRSAHSCDVTVPDCNRDPSSSPGSNCTMRRACSNERLAAAAPMTSSLPAAPTRGATGVPLIGTTSR